MPEPELARGPTEERNADTHDIDLLSTVDVLRRINAEDSTVPRAVAAVLPELARAVDTAVDRLRDGGAVHYFGAGTSGRLATMDAVELPPTFGIDPSRVVAHHAGGEDALTRPHESAEDDEELGAADARALTRADLAVGLTASGRTPYVAGALRAARRAGASTVLVSAHPDAALGEEVDIHIGMATGAEVIAGSTRMKAATAQKLVLNALSTAVMVRLGHTYSNLMVGLTAANTKLDDRAVTVLVEAGGLDRDTCAEALRRAGGDTRTALVSLLAEVDTARAAEALRSCDGSVRAALGLLGNR